MLVARVDSVAVIRWGFWIVISMGRQSRIWSCFLVFWSAAILIVGMQ